MTWFPAYIGVGSNLNDPQAQVRSALRAIAARPGLRQVAASGLYCSPPLGPQEQPDFINAAAGVLTQLPPRELLASMQALEIEHGRERKGPRWGPRTLDLDLLVYSSWRCDEPELVVPHPRMQERAFVLKPLAEIAPTLRIPQAGTVSELLLRLDHAAVVRL